MTAPTARRVLIVSAGDKPYEYFSQLLPRPDFPPAARARSAGEARRFLSQSDVDLLIVDTPLPDESGVDFALSVAERNMGILMLVKAEVFERVSYQVEEQGILTVSKPNSRQVFYSSVKLLIALGARLQKMERKNRSLQEKMADIRAVNRAKWLLIDKLKMSEQDAHYFIQRKAMDAQISRREAAEDIIRAYES